MSSWLLALCRKLPFGMGLQRGSKRIDLRMLVGANDPVTGLPGPNAFDNTLEQAMGQAELKSRQLALLLVSIDNVKSLDQTLGARESDQILRQAAQRLHQLVPPFMAARLAADEFALLMNDDPQAEDAAVLATQVLSELTLPVSVGRGPAISLTSSVGVVMYPDSGAVESIIPRARVAMANAKAAGGARYAFFDASMTKGPSGQIELLRDLRSAVELDQLELHYQPKIHAPTGEITGAEALLRWNHPVRGMVSPAAFIPLAERSGLIIPIGRWVIEEACRQLHAWRDQGIRMRIAINLSVHQLRQPDLAEQIADALRTHQINPELLTCEVTETSAMVDVDTTVRVLRKLHAMGIQISIDDFGTGHSSLAYLRSLPVDELKIDRSFVLDLETSADARKVAQAVVNLAKALDHKVVAEGVETEAQNRLLREFGCDQLQGYLFAKPMSATALALWATENVGPRAMNFRASIFKDTTPVGDTASNKP